MSEQNFSAEEVESFKAIGKRFAARAQREAEMRADDVERRLAAARRQLADMITRFREVDSGLRRIVLFGSMAHGKPRNPQFDIDLAVDSDRYWELLGIAMNQEIPVDLIDLKHVASHIRGRIDAEGVEVFLG